MSKPTIGFVGLGKLGLECAEVFAQHYETYGYDVQPRKSDSVIVLDKLGELVEESDWIFIAVPTPHEEQYDGREPSCHLRPKDFNYKAVKEVLIDVNYHAKNTNKNIVLISTVLPGTVRREFDPVLENHSLIYNPYLIAMGTTKWDMVNPEMLIIGSKEGEKDPKVKELIDIYSPVMEQPETRVEMGTWEEAESIKIFYNTFISAKISLVNMIQDFAMKIGNINAEVVAGALARSDKRIMGPQYMVPGMGDSGACVLPEFPVTVDDKVVTIKELYESFNDENVTLIESANYTCTAKDQKKIATVTCREYKGEVLRFIDGDEVLLECTPEHLVPVSRKGKRLIVRADEILETDKLYRL